MGRINWQELLKWSDEQLEDIRQAGYAYIRQGKYDMALPLYEALVVLDKSEPYDLQTLGALYLELDMPKEARKTLDRALQLEGDHSPTLLNFTKSLFMLGKIKEGLKLAEILKDDPSPRVASMAKALLLAYS